MSLKNISLAILFFVCLVCPKNAYSVKPTPAKNPEQTETVKKRKKPGIVKRWLIKRLVKKIRKEQNEIGGGKDTKLLKRAWWSFISGIISFGLLFLGILAPPIWIVAALLALVGDILALNILSRTSNDKETYKKERTLSTVGLILSLLTGLIPLALLAIVLISI